jgi:hypothetical protein
VGPLNTTAGTLAAQPASDETNVVQFLNQTGTSVLDVDTSNARVRAGTEVVHMKTPLLIVLGAIVLMAGSGLAIMNNACKSNHHAWCAQMSDIRHHVKTGHS